MNSLRLDSPGQLLFPTALLLIIAALVLLRRFPRSQSAANASSGALGSEALARAAEKCLSGSCGQYAVVAMRLRNYRQLRLTFGSDNCSRTMKHLCGTARSVLSSAEPLGQIDRSTFCLIIKNRQKDAIRARLVRIAERANQFNKQLPIPYTLDLIFGIYLPENNQEEFDVMLEKALQTLDDSKSSTQFRFFSGNAAMDNARRSWELLEQMSRSLNNGDFVVYMQPKVRLGDSQIVGAEALVRWRHPQRGLLTPEMFVPLLEEYRLIHRFDQYLFEQVCAKMAQWRQEGLAPCPVSVNLSLQTLAHDRFLEPYISLTKKYRISPELIEFELGEPLLFENPKMLRALTDEIRSYGFQCSLDHFGRTAIPLHLLRELNINTLKLDRSFFSGENNSRPNRYIVEAILKITSQMQIHTVAEGIDNASQVHYLRQAGCDTVQGFYYFRPMPVESFQKAAFQGGQLRYVETDDTQSGKGPAPSAPASGSNIIMFTLLETQDRVVFSDVFSPLLYGQFAVSQASALFGHSDLIHENDRKDFFHLLERCRREEGWVDNTLRFYTSEARYEWLQVYMHHEHTAGGESVVSGTLVNIAGWKNEVNRWMEKASRDPLTGLYNREYFEQFTSSAIEKGTLGSGAIIFFDLDNFKNVNDTLGHMVGDDVLCFIAKRLRGIFRHSDVIARYGGDEFVVFANSIERADLEKRLQELCRILETPYRNDAIEYRLSGSIGAAVYPDDGENYPLLLSHADTAAYVAKKQGKAQFVFYQAGMEEDVDPDMPQ